MLKIKGMSEAKVEKIKEAAHKITVNLIVPYLLITILNRALGLFLCYRSRTAREAQKGVGYQHGEQICRYHARRGAYVPIYH